MLYYKNIVFRNAVKVVLYFLLLTTLYISTIHLLKIKVSLHSKNLQRINSQILTEYQALSKLSANILAQICKFTQEDSVKATIISQTNLLPKFDSQFELCVEDGNYEVAIYIMNKKFSRFFEIINYSWEALPNVRNDTALISQLASISEMELIIDSLVNIAISEKKQSLFYFKILRILNPFKKAKNRIKSSNIQNTKEKTTPNIL